MDRPHWPKLASQNLRPYPFEPRGVRQRGSRNLVRRRRGSTFFGARIIRKRQNAFGSEPRVNGVNGVAGVQPRTVRSIYLGPE